METASILVCEDERLVAKDIESALKRNGYKIVGIAADGEEALRLARESAPDLALMDIRLKGSLSGIDVAEMLAKELGIPSIYLTAYADDETLEQAKATHPLSYLLKPFNEVELKAAVEVGLHRYRAEQQVVSALQNYIEEQNTPEAVERAVQLEREFLETERVNSQMRVAGNIAAQLGDQIDLLSERIEQVAQDQDLSDQQKNLLHGALVHHDRVSHVVSQLEKCADVEKQVDKTVGTDVVVDTVISEAIRETIRLLGKKVNFVECFAAELPLVRADRQNICEALVEVLLNAYQSMPQEPLVMISTSLVYEEFPERFNPRARPGDFILLKVSDFGKGISEKELERIFEPCFSASGMPLNAGLGLSIAFAVMQSHGGWITVESTRGAGTQVSLFLPCVPIAPNVEVLN